VLPIRGILYTFTDEPALLIAIQIPDGVGAGIFNVVSVLVIADLDAGHGSIQPHGSVAVTTAVGIGASAQPIVVGASCITSGLTPVFFFLAAVAAGHPHPLFLHARDEFNRQPEQRKDPGSLPLAENSDEKRQEPCMTELPG